MFQRNLPGQHLIGVHDGNGTFSTRPSASAPSKIFGSTRWFSSSRRLQNAVSGKLKMPSDGSCWHRAFIALGSNLGDRVGAIERACCEMERAGIRVKKTSSLFETAPMYVTDQEPFINGACEVGILLFYT